MITRTRDTATTATFGVSDHERDQAWALAGQWSPRRTIRVANNLIDGVLENTYATVADLDGPAPFGTWAMYLTDEHGYYRWIAFDLDPKNGRPATDAKRLTSWLKQLGIPYLVCRSGPSGGRHVWVRADRLHPSTVAGIAHRAKSLLPSLDISPLTNVRYGAVRPPLSPHREAGFSWPIGDPYVLDNHDGMDEDDARALLDLLDSLGAEAPVPETAGIRGMVADAHGHPRMQGKPRRVSPRILRLLREGDDTIEDKSVLQATVLAGLAQARWSFADVAKHLDSSPAFEHARTVIVGARRVPRGARRARRTLLNGWKLAVRFVAANPLSSDGLDDDFIRRSNRVTAAVYAAQVRADTQPGRWGSGAAVAGARGGRGRPSHRAVLDAVLLHMLEAVSLEVGVDSRRLAMETGYSKESTRLALLELCDDEYGSPWLVKTHDADGPNSAVFKLHDRFSTDNEDTDLALAPTPPPGRADHTSPPRDVLIRQLGEKIGLLAHDVFASPGSLGRSAGRVLQVMPEGSPLRVADLIVKRHLPARSVRRALLRLHSSGMIEHTASGWVRGPDIRDRVADELGVTGYLEERAARYEFDRYLWRWWLVEQAIAHRKRSGAGRPSPSAVPIPDVAPVDEMFPRYPRRPDRKRDCLRARSIARERLDATGATPPRSKPVLGRKVPGSQRGVRFVA